ncbi:MAG: hypothetical protein FWE25_10790 [Lachnospiraceae bacterium]|nr:hypothetical protein [Lachnospiraceae bacterium]
MENISKSSFYEVILLMLVAKMNLSYKIKKVPVSVLLSYCKDAGMADMGFFI